MRILATNDDGIYANGLWHLARALKDIGEVTIAAPDREQSAVGTSVTLHHPLRARQIKSLARGVKCYSVEGTPADSVILALKVLLNDSVDLLVSGINEGSNLGSDVLISGTVGAALQGYLQGIPSVALSVGGLGKVHLDAAARLAAVIAKRVKATALPKDTFLNINLPNLPLSKIKGIEITHLGERSYGDIIEEGHDGKRTYYWIVRDKPIWEPTEGTDIWALIHDKISITPLKINLTSHKALPALEQLSSAIFQELGSPQRHE